MMTPTTENVLSVYHRAGADALREGLVWYADAHNFARSLDSDIHRAAGIIAALSPMNGWENNKNKAALLYAQNGNGDNVGLKNNVVKSQRILSGEHPLSVLGGDKVRSFYLTIANPLGDHSPVIDRHAFDIAVGKVTDNKSRSLLSRKGMYETFASCYREAAGEVMVSPAQIQAITWVQWRIEKGIV